MTEILELQTKIENLEKNQSNQTVTANINNPWVIAVALMSIIGYVYFDQQENQNNGIQSNTELIEQLQEDQRANTDAITKMTSAVTQVVKDVDHNRELSHQNTRDLTIMRTDRFTDKDGASIEKDVMQLKEEVARDMLRDKEELRGWLRSLEDELDKLNKSVTKVEAKTRLME